MITWDFCLISPIQRRFVVLIATLTKQISGEDIIYVQTTGPHSQIIILLIKPNRAFYV